MEFPTSDRVNRIKPSPTLAISARAAELRAKGKDIISLSVGEPDFDTPGYVKDGAIRAIHDGLTKYTAVDGTPGLKQAIIQKFERENILAYEPNQILVSCGCKHSIYNLLQAIVNDGDEVVIPKPYWVSYPDMVLLAGGTPVFVDSTIESRFKITPEQLEAAITPKTKLVLFNSPSNPSGVAYTKAELAAFGEVMVKHPNILIATDDIYEHILWAEEPFANILNACPELYKRTIVFNGVSKAFAMTGWRIGYAAGPANLIAAMKKVQSQSTSNPTSISQAAAEEALKGCEGVIDYMLKAYKERHDFVIETLTSMDGFELTPGDGTFYTFAKVQKIIDRMDNINDDVEFSEHLLNNAGVAVVPGSAFGTPGCIRLSFATSVDVLKDALGRIKEVLV